MRDAVNCRYHDVRMLQRVAVAVVFVLLVLMLLLVLRGQQAPDAGREGLQVVTTTPVLYSLTVKVLGARGSVTNLVPPGVSPENYALRPQDAAALERADVLVTNGLNFEQFLESVIDQARQRGVHVIVASEGIETKPIVGHHREEGSREERLGPDPHVWVDPLRAKRMVGNIARGLAVADSTNAAAYQRSVSTAEAALDALDKEFRAALALLADRRFIAFHPAWGYFAERYGLEQIAVVEEFPGKEPTAQELYQLSARVRATGVQVLFSEPQFSPKIVEALARDLGLTVSEVNPEGGELSPQGYENFMRENVRVFRLALRGVP